MRILAADDEPLALEMLSDAVREAAPDAQLETFLKPTALLAFAKEHPADVAFLDIRMRGMTGVVLAKRLKELTPALNIVFVTGYEEYTGDAMAMHASGYIRKPVTAEKVRTELMDLRHPVAPMEKAKLRIKCFGNFDAYTPDGLALRFERTKAKELLAYLIYRAGASCSVKEIAAALFEDGAYDKKQQGYVQKIISSMMRSLKSADAEAVIQKTYNSMSVDTALVDCDYYRFAALDAAAVNAYSGEFMSQYAWAEFAIGYLEDVYKTNNTKEKDR